MIAAAVVAAVASGPTFVTTARRCPARGADVCIECSSVLEADVRSFEYIAIHGGVYIDTDVTVKRGPSEWPAAFPLLPWRSGPLVVGVEFPRPPGVGTDGCCLQFAHWTFMAAAGSGILKEVAATGRRAIARGAAERDAVHATGPGCLTRVLLRHIGAAFNLSAVELSGGAYTSEHTGELVVILPYRAFGIHPAHRGDHITRTPVHQQLVRHAFRGSWRTN